LVKNLFLLYLAYFEMNEIHAFSKTKPYISTLKNTLDEQLPLDIFLIDSYIDSLFFYIFASGST